MNRPPRPQIPHMHWGYHRPPLNPVWRHSFEPRTSFRAHHQRFNYSRPPFQSQNDNYWCETCDRGFATEAILNKHKQQHQKCNIDGCEFIAHPKVITKHIQMQHSTGLYKKIANLKNPEEIAKWREERRKRYPTKSNIEKKAAELKEKIERGEKMGLSRDRGYRNKPNSEQDNRPGQGIKRKFNSRNENQPKSKFKKINPSDNKHYKNAPPKTKKAPVVVEDSRLKPFAGILNLQMDSENEIENDVEELNDLIEDDDDYVKSKSENVEKVHENNEPIVCGALSSLICDYGSSDDEENSTKHSKVIKAVSKNTQSSKNMQNNQSNKPVIAQSGSLVMECDAKVYEQSINIRNSVSNQTECEEDNALIKYNSEGNIDLVDFANKSVQNNVDQSNNIKENSEIDRIISVPVENCDIHNNNNSSRSEGVKTDINKTTCSEGTRNNACVDNIKKKIIQQTNQNEDHSDSGPEETKADVRKEDTTEVPEDTKTREIRKTVVKGRMQVNQRRRPKLPSTLLHKLLHKEIQQERNIVLQCVRYITRNNYFNN